MTRTIWDPLDPILQTLEVERQKVALFFSCVPGKEASVIWPKVERFLGDASLALKPFHSLKLLRDHSLLLSRLQHYRLSPYDQVLRRLSALADLPEGRWTWSYLRGKYGFGLKTLHCIALYTDPCARVAGLDRHILRWLNSMGYPVPLTTPTVTRVYQEISQYFLKEADRVNLKPWQLDRQIWMEGRLRSAEKRNRSSISSTSA